MSPYLRSPAEAAGFVAARLNKAWAQLLCAEISNLNPQALECSLRPGIKSSPDVERIGFDAWHSWRTAWKHVDLTDLAGVELEHREIQVRGVGVGAPFTLRVITLDAGLALIGRLDPHAQVVDVDRARRIGIQLRHRGAEVTPATLRAVNRLPDSDVNVMLGAIAWLREHSELSGWTARQLPVPGVHTKWLSKHERLVKTLISRDVATEVRPRLSVVHFTYTDPDYLATGGRRHDAWTSGDSHAPAYQPRIVLVVENRDCRLWFPEMPDTIIVEGEGKAAASLGAVDWLRGAERLIYWGDVDSDGFSILNNFRAELQQHGMQVDSLLMDGMAWARYMHLGVSHDKRGDPLRPSNARLPNLTHNEAECYARVATAGDVAIRRIEQERIPLPEAETELLRLLKT